MAKKTKVVAKDETTTKPKTPKKEVIKKFQTHGKDTGSAEVQIAIYTHRITELSAHLENHKKDKHSRRGLLGLVGKRRRMLRYLKIHNPEKYSEITSTLGLRK